MEEESFNLRGRVSQFGHQRRFNFAFDPWGRPDDDHRPRGFILMIEYGYPGGVDADVNFFPAKTDSVFLYPFEVSSEFFGVGNGLVCETGQFIFQNILHHFLLGIGQDGFVPAPA